ncbi:SDR family NAD(P)-dependent oxidoreductase [Flavobacterium weaverense]|uniref:Nucleoside-diphosphate-sugar epimerase n=1 Tax=Flavobacterium weaverense TaxID=271156 RepID=A0A3L9ZXG0_9FLAO|nr:SDR family NAD(P)-dependent oxidoreductase [Flavobacterium weaverense]RMA76924.1 nucleoside-diphosphate-sugar epimerase [Flavobacterium weaverense]
MTKISILGCGWLGMPLAEALLDKGLQINGSTTTVEKLSLLQSENINPFLIDIPSIIDEGSLEMINFSSSMNSFLHGSETLIIDIPPKLRSASVPADEKTFVKKIAALIPFIIKSTVQNVLFVSSTSVYGENQGTVDESTIPEPETESGKQLLECESLLKSNSNFKTTILRFGGLIGFDRQPGKYLAGRENLENPESPVNLIHQKDCIGIILKIIESDYWNETFNAVSPFHPSRESYYSQKAADLNLPLPKFDHSKPSVGKLIENNKIINLLKYTFTEPNL